MEERSNALSVSQAMDIAKRQLEDITLKIVGEVSEFSSNARYKAVYFTVKDEKASLPCMMWKNRYDAADAPLQVGALVELTGRFTLYAAKGRMNFDVFSIELAGEGRLRMQVANLAKKLEAEGLMRGELKKPLPYLPQRIGLVTSPRGAAVYDVLRTLRRRFPSAEVLFAGVGVEGAKAPAEMSEALKELESAGAEVILLVRGGGSFEDLMPFNDEGLARTVASMKVPIVTGIGHERDNSIADMVSDFRASTPTAAAEAVVPASEELLTLLRSKSYQMASVIKSRLAKSESILEGVAKKPVFSEPQRLFESESQFLDDMTMRLYQAITNALQSQERRIYAARSSLKAGLASLLSPYSARIEGANASMGVTGSRLLAPFESMVSRSAAKLEALSPLSVLARGYSITRDDSGGIMKSVSSTKAGDSVSVQLEDGSLDCTVDRITRQEYSLEGIDG